MMNMTIFTALYAGGTGFIRLKYWACSLITAANRRSIYDRRLHFMCKFRVLL